MDGMKHLVLVFELLVELLEVEVELVEVFELLVFEVLKAH